MIKQKYNMLQIKKKIAVVLGVLLALFLFVGSVMNISAANLVIHSCTAIKWTDGVCDTCGYACVHEFSGVTCSVCGFICSHDTIVCEYTYDDQYHSGIGTCDTCGSVQYTVANELHIYDADSVAVGTYICAKCDYAHVHDFSAGDCVCGKPCPHDYNVDQTSGQATCTLCDATCVHDTFLNAICQECGYECVNHNWSSTAGACLICEKICYHPSTKIFYVENSTTNQHTVRIICDVCGGRDYSNPLNGAYEPCTFVDSVCSVCGRICAHTFNDGVCSICGFACIHERYSAQSDGSYVCYDCGFIHSSHNYALSSVSSGNVQYHTTTYTCIECTYSYTDYEDPHSYNSTGYCNICSYQCSHAYQNGVCLGCGGTCSAHTYNDGDGVCSICGLVCDHSSVEFHYTPCPNSDKNDHLEPVCTVCDIGVVMDHSRYGECKPCSWSSSGDGVCLKCDRVHVHSEWKNEKCIVCSYQCPHKFYVDGICDRCGFACKHTDVDVIYYDGWYRFSFDCNVCGDRIGNDVYYTAGKYDSPNLYKFGVANSSWNAITTVSIEDLKRPYQTLMIDEFTEKYQYNASLHLLGGDDIKDGEALPSTVNSSRYLAMRIRKCDISHFQLYLAFDDQAICFEDVTTECSSIHFFEVETLPDDEWISLCFDLSKFSGLADTYVIDREATDGFFVLTATFVSEDGYVDVEYFAFCDDLEEVDLAFNTQGFDPMLYNYTMVTGNYTTTAETMHVFDNGGRCDYCRKICEHLSTTTVAVTNNKQCGDQTFCDVCGIMTVSSVAPHDYLEGNESSECTLCGHICYHMYSIGSCIYCDRECEHKYRPNSASCMYCFYIPDMPAENDDSLAFSLITSIFDSQANTFLSMLNYNIFGVNIAMVIGALIVLAVTIFIIKKVK